MKIIDVLTGQKRILIRDPLSLFLCFMPFVLFIFVQVLLKISGPYLLKWFNIYDYYTFIKFVVYLISPTLIGMVLGLLLVDEKDQNVLSFINITPLGLKRYLLFKYLFGAAVGLIYNTVLALLFREIFTPNVILTILISSLLVPYFAGAIFTFSHNKVEALTKGKLFSFTIFAGIIPYFISSPWTILLIIFPTNCIFRVYFSSF